VVQVRCSGLVGHGLEIHHSDPADASARGDLQTLRVRNEARPFNVETLAQLAAKGLLVKALGAVL